MGHSAHDREQQPANEGILGNANDPDLLVDPLGRAYSGKHQRKGACTIVLPPSDTHNLIAVPGEACLRFLRCGLDDPTLHICVAGAGP